MSDSGGRPKGCSNWSWGSVTLVASTRGTRHNIGFEVVDQLAQGGSGTKFSRKFEGQVAEVEIDFRRVLLLKPETFMNLSGRSVVPAPSVLQARTGRSAGPLR